MSFEPGIKPLKMSENESGNPVSKRMPLLSGQKWRKSRREPMFPGPSFYPVTSMFTGPFNGPGFHAGCLHGSASLPTVELHPCSNTAPAFLGRDFVSFVRIDDGSLGLMFSEDSLSDINNQKGLSLSKTI